MQPVLFLSHGSPMLALEPSPAHRFLRELGRSLPRPDAVVVVSAHWETAVPTANAVTVNETIHDFRGFPAALYNLRYPAPGAPELAARIVDLAAAAGLRAAQDTERGLDHGAWVPLLLLWPEHDIPVVQVSVQTHLGPGHHLQLGRALQPLRAENVLVIGSGSMTHNLGEIQGWSEQGDVLAEPDWVTGFAEWIDAAILDRRVCDLLAYRRIAPFAVRNHPSEEHLLPLFAALGAAGADFTATRLHRSTEYRVLRMDAYRFD